jgi:hypothetical protein
MRTRKIKDGRREGGKEGRKEGRSIKEGRPVKEKRNKGKEEASSSKTYCSVVAITFDKAPEERRKAVRKEGRKGNEEKKDEK